MIADCKELCPNVDALVVVCLMMYYLYKSLKGTLHMISIIPPWVACIVASRNERAVSVFLRV